MHAVLPGKRLRDRARSRQAAASDQCVELRALQDVRHHGPVRGHHVGPARRGPGSSIQWHVSRVSVSLWPVRVTDVPLADDWRASPFKRFQVAAIAALAYPLINALGYTLRWRVEGLHHLAAIHASG